MSAEKTGQLILHPTAEIFQRGIKVCCPVCQQEIIPGMPVERLIMGNSWFWVHEECFDGELEVI